MKQAKQPIKQQGAATLLVSIVLLVAVTLVVIFAARVGIMDQRIAANEYRHKEAKAAAEAALDQAGAFVEQNPDLYTGTGAQWTDCTSSVPLQAAFPCTVGSDEYAKVYSNVAGTTIEPLAYMTSLSNNAQADSYLVFTASASIGNILTAVGDGASLDGSGQAQAQVSYTQATLLTPGTIPPLMAPFIDLNGTFTIVADPNVGSASGIPLSAWVDNLDGAAPTGTWQTCQVGSFKNGDDICTETYGADSTAGGWSSCECDTTDILSDKDNINPDIFEDPDNFPSDVFGYIFNGASEAEIKQRAIAIGHVYPDCTDLANVDLTEGSLVWIEGECDIDADVASQDVPIILVVDGLLKVTGNNHVWGVLLSTVNIQLSGNPMVHGSLISTSTSKLTAGSYTQIYDEKVLKNLTDPSANVELSKVRYSWKDYVN